jgi:hypothetical protein
MVTSSAGSRPTISGSGTLGLDSQRYSATARRSLRVAADSSDRVTV